MDGRPLAWKIEPMRLQMLLVLLPLLACTTSTAGGEPSPAAGAPAESVDAGAPAEEAPAEPVARPSYCTAAKSGLVDLTKTPAGPYFVHHPTSVGTSEAPTILFIPGGRGTRDTATVTFDEWLSRGKTLGAYRVVMPYADDGDLTDEGERTIAVLDEVVACYGSKLGVVHLGGTSNGGRAAYALMLEHPDRFATLLGAPGLFSSATDATLTAALPGKAVFNAAGALDSGWRTQVEATNKRLVGLGLDSAYAALPGQGHVLDEKADQEVFFSFWAAHAVSTPQQ